MSEQKLAEWRALAPSFEFFWNYYYQLPKDKAYALWLQTL